MIIGLIISNSLKELLAGKGREKVLYFYTPGKKIPYPYNFPHFLVKLFSKFSTLLSPLSSGQLATVKLTNKSTVKQKTKEVVELK